jgi:hypothetical protein
MKTATMLYFSAAALFVLAPIAARADHKEYQGRTGLPTVREGGEKTWMERGTVNLQVRGSDLAVTQDFLLHYPGTKLEKGADQMRVAVREDFFRSKDGGASDVTDAEARGFRTFGVWIDGRRVNTVTEPWIINDKKDTATRWRNWWVQFTPGKVHKMRIESVAPLGWDGDRRTAQFVSKDIGHWRDVPDYLEIKFMAPANVETKLATLEPDTKDVSNRAVRWIYRKANPHRDIMVELPPGYGSRRSMR